MKLKISAAVIVLDETAGNSRVEDPARLATIDGAASDECFSEYLTDDLTTKALPSRGVSGGGLRFRYLPDRQEVWAETEYDLREPLTGAEQELLLNYTLGQWSDGIGENFSQEYADETGLFLSLHPEHATIEIA